MALEPSAPTWSTDQLRALFLDYFKEKGSQELPSSSLVPQDDPTVLLTTAGMQQMIPYLLGRREPPSRGCARSRSASVRRTSIKSGTPAR